MSAPRHRSVVERPVRRRLLRVGLPLAAVAVAVGVGVATSAFTDARGPSTRHTDAAQHVSAPTAVLDGSDSPYQLDRLRTISRSTQRVTLHKLPRVTDHRFGTARLNVWPAPKAAGKPLTVLRTGDELAVTGVRRHGFAQVVRQGQVRWVTATYLADRKPAPRSAATGSGPSTGAAGTTGGPLLSSAPCPSGSGMESGIVPQAVTLHRTVCAHFPQVTTYGGWRGDGEHSDGHAIDIMVYGDHATGQAIADWVRANAAALHVDDVIWSQHIWTTQRAAEGWRMMPDRGSITANHYDHVHVRVF